MGVAPKGLDHLVDQTDERIGRYVESGLNKTGKELAIKLYRTGFTVLDPKRAGYYIQGYSSDFTYALNIAESESEAQELLHQGLELMESYGLSVHSSTIVPPKKANGLCRVEIIVNFQELLQLEPPTLPSGPKAELKSVISNIDSD